MSINQRRLGVYELHQHLGSGAINELWKAFDTQQHRYVMINILQVNPQAAADLIPRFNRETQNLVYLQHPNIVPIVEVHASYVPGAANNEAYIVMEYVDGQSLADYLNATSHAGNFPMPSEIVRLLAPIAAAIDYAHRQGIIHGMIKPGNILLDKHSAPDQLPEPRLIGFGMHALQAPLTLSLDDVFYVSPELAQGYTENARSDLYSLGIILYELCTGTLPFQGDSPSDVMLQHIHSVPTSPALINPHILPAITAVIMRSLSKDPIARFSSASAMVAAIAKAANLPIQDILGQSGSFSGGMRSGSDTMNSPTYLSPASPYRSSGGATPVPPAASNPVLSSQQIPTVHAPTSSTPTYATVPGSPLASGGPNTLPPSFAQSPAYSPSSSSPPQVLPVAPAFSPPSATTIPKRGRRGLYLGLVVFLVIVLLASGGTWFLAARNVASVQRSVVGHAFFVSSGLLEQNSNQGVADRVQIDLQGLPAPQSGKNYCAWLLNDNDANINIQPILLGVLSIKNGNADLSFLGNAQNSDLLASYSRFLVTEEDAAATPTNPSLNPADWRYYAAFSQVPNPLDTANHFSVLSHLRHLLAADPKLKLAGITGGLDTWLFRNTLKVLEWSGSARDAYNANDSGLIRRQLVRILDYLDGSQFIQTENIPADLPVMLADPTISRVSLLEISPSQEPPGYLKHIGNHLRELTESPGVTPEQKNLAIEINNAINNVQARLNAVHSDAEKLIHMSPAQLMQPDNRTMLNDIFVEANAAFVGQTDPNTNQVKEGVSQIHYEIQRLATFDITACTSKNTANPCV